MITYWGWLGRNYNNYLTVQVNGRSEKKLFAVRLTVLVIGIFERALIFVGPNIRTFSVLSLLSAVLCSAFSKLFCNCPIKADTVGVYSKSLWFKSCWKLYINIQLDTHIETDGQSFTNDCSITERGKMYDGGSSCLPLMAIIIVDVIVMLFNPKVDHVYCKCESPCCLWNKLQFWYGHKKDLNKVLHRLSVRVSVCVWRIIKIECWDNMLGWMVIGCNNLSCVSYTSAHKNKLNLLFICSTCHSFNYTPHLPAIFFHPWWRVNNNDYDEHDNNNNPLSTPLKTQFETLFSNVYSVQ